MGTRQQIVDFILEQLSGVRDATARKMFGEFALYSAGKVVALVCDDQLFVKPTAAGAAFIGTVTEGAPYPGAKPWFLIDGDHWEDGDWLSELIRLTASALPMPKRKSAPRRPAPARAGSTVQAQVQARTTASLKAKRKAPGKPQPKPARKASSTPKTTPKRKATRKLQAKK
jgi:TfoX/Sxy family transcriptional regulator of competence genes